MANTGAPWNIPFAEPSDLVRDWPALSSAVGTAVAAGLTAANEWAVAQVVSSNKTAAQSISNTFPSETYSDITGLSVTITPSSTDSTILIIAAVQYHIDNVNANAKIRLMRNATPLVGTQSCSFQFGDQERGDSASWVYIDSPSTTSATTYKLQGTSFGNFSGTPVGTLVINRAGQGGGMSGITALEIR
jgi:hypothetical protein